MSAPEPGLLSLVPFVSVDNMMRIVWDIGVERMITELAAYIFRPSPLSECCRMSTAAIRC